MERKVYLKLTPLQEAKDLWLTRLEELLPPLAVEEVPLAAAHDRVLAEPAAAVLSSPAFHGAAMDGIAVAADNTFGASESRPKQLQVGRDAFWINTGHPLPEGTNAVIMVENVIPLPPATPGDPQLVEIEQAAFPWQHVRKLGEDMVATEILLPPGTRIGAYELGALAAAGVLRPRVFARPKVAVIPSGSELVSLDQATPEMLSSGAKLPEFNSLIFSALIREAGGIPVLMPTVPDAMEALEAALEAATSGDIDLVVINAGSSAGSHDFTPEVIAKAGELWIHGVTVMPGKPTALGMINGKPVIGAPGYPVSATISFEEFGLPLLARMQKRHLPRRPTLPARPFQAMPSRPGMEERIRVKLGEVDGSFIAVPLPRGAGTVTSLSRADGIITIAADAEGLPADKPVPVSLLRPKEQITGALLAVGSHDNTLDLLDGFLRKKNPLYSLASAHVGSLGGITALREGRCHLAGSHLLDPKTGTYNQTVIAGHLQGIAVQLVRLVDRQQGLILPPGNPRNISCIADLALPGTVFINRQRGSGTRVLLDYELSRLSIVPSALEGYENEEYTHMNVAAAVLSGRAHAGLGVQAAANALGLDFVPVGVEEYDLVIPMRYADDPRITALLDVIRSQEFKNAALALGGYGTDKTGEVIWTFPGR